MSVFSQLLWWRHPPLVDEPRPALTSERDRQRRTREAERLRQLMDLVDLELDTLRAEVPRQAPDD